jgi:predicted permease
MRWLAETWRKLLMIARRDQLERDLEEEMQDHVARKAAELGDPHAARRALGNSTRLREESREAWAWMWIERLIQDLRYAFRVLTNSPGFTAVALLTVALATAGCVTVYSFIDALFLRSLNVEHADRLVRMYGTGKNSVNSEVSYAEYTHIRDHITALDSVTAHYSTAPLYVNINGEAGELSGAVVSSRYFPTLGLKPALGRFFSLEEDSVPDRDAVAVIGYGLWRSRFGGDPAVTGRSLRINGKTFQVIGVAPEDFGGVLLGQTPNQVWIPLMMVRTGYRWCDALSEDCHLLSIHGRLASGKTVSEARSEMEGLLRQVWNPSASDSWHIPLVLEPATGIRPRDQRSAQTLARLLAITAGMLLVIACANLGGLLLARGTARAKEIAMRISLGASRLRILRQLLTESILLAALGGALGLVLSRWTSQLLMGFYRRDAEGYGRFYDLRLDPQVVIFAAAVSLGAGVLFGLLPALLASRGNTGDTLRSSGAGSGVRSRLRAVLVAAQVALSLTLLVGAGLLARSGSNLENQSSFDVHHVVAARLRPRLMSYSPAKAQVFLREVVNRLNGIGEVESVTFTSGLGLVWGPGGQNTLSLPADLPADPQRPSRVSYQEVAPRFFETLRIGILQGREFDGHDVAGAQQVAVVNESLARRLWPYSSALEKVIVFAKRPYRVVGVARDSMLYSADSSATPMVFVPFWQDSTQVDARMAIRVRGDAESAIPEIKRTISSIDPDVPITELMPMIGQVRGHFADVRLAGAVLLSTSLLAVLLSALGLYGVIAFVAARRTREVGIRMALGARPGEVVAMFLKQGLALLVVGGIAGLVLALATTRMLKAWLYGISASDPVAFSAGIAVLGFTAVLASWIPARRAARIDPMAALRSD